MNEVEYSVLSAALRIITLARAVQESGKRMVRAPVLAECLHLYDEAVRKWQAPSTYDRIRDPSNLEGEPKEEPKPAEPADREPPVPEPETIMLYRAYESWREVFQAAEAELRRLQQDPAHIIHVQGADRPSKELARAYSRVYRAQDVLAHLIPAIEDAVSAHIDDETTAGVTKIKWRLEKLNAATEQTDPETTESVTAPATPEPPTPPPENP
jgi:hypothetical protein